MKTVLILVLALFALGHTDAMAQHKAATPVVYSCPMHVEVKAKKPGKCPKCKMDLVKQTTAINDR